jgi:diguanylate cyclase (GGDEF)-like protein
MSNTLTTAETNTLLSKLVALTHGGDEVSLEMKLLGLLSDFVGPVNNHENAVAIYHLIHLEKQRFSRHTQQQHETNIKLTKAHQQAVMHCFTEGVVGLYQPANAPHVKLYPIKDFAEKVISVVEITMPNQEAGSVDTKADTAIGMMLEIYQNFTKLMNDNECDTLTGLLNRKTFDSKINKIITQMRTVAKRKEDKSAQFYYLAIFDIDHFKRVNDNFGHLIGDEVLLMFSQLMKQSFRDSDPLFRFGGEEFVGVFGCNHVNDINTILERFRNKMAQFVFPQVGKVTVSAGYTEIQDFDNSSQLIDRADSALYFAKNHGRNQVACYEHLVATGELQVNKKEGDIELF